MTDWHAPNQQTVGVEPASELAPASEAAPTAANPLDAMTKDQLIVYAAEHQIEIPASGTKADIRAAIDAAG